MGDAPHTETPGGADPPPRSGGEWHRVTLERSYIRAELFNRTTLEETRKFLDDTIAAASEHGCSHLLICIRNSKPIFAVERYGFSRYLNVALDAGYKIALFGSTKELRIAHQYYATLARARGVNLRAFSNEAAAIAWLMSAKASLPSTEAGLHT